MDRIEEALDLAEQVHAWVGKQSFNGSGSPQTYTRAQGVIELLRAELAARSEPAAVCRPCPICRSHGNCPPKSHQPQPAREPEAGKG